MNSESGRLRIATDPLAQLRAVLPLYVEDPDGRPLGHGLAVAAALAHLYDIARPDLLRLVDTSGFGPGRLGAVPLDDEVAGGERVALDVGDDERAVVLDVVLAEVGVRAARVFVRTDQDVEADQSSHDDSYPDEDDDPHRLGDRSVVATESVHSLSGCAGIEYR